MGQYYLVANIDKRERLCINGKKIGGKLMEIALERESVNAILNQMAGAWKGDLVLLVGDYAYQGTSNDNYYKLYRQLESKFHLVDSLYDYVYEKFRRIDGDTADVGLRFIYNHSQKNYIDLRHCPQCCDGKDWRQESISPLPILIAMGNGLGGGDYGNSDNEHLAGSWCESISTVEITIEPKDELGYEEFRPDFDYPEW